MEKFKLGFMVGRFQMLHKGHESLINEGLELCDRFVILLGNSEESRTENNPFSFEERKEMIQKVYGNKVEIYPIINIGIGYVPEWGNYIMNTIKFYCGKYPDFVIRGSDNGRNQWIDKNKYSYLTELIVSRSLISYSGSFIREHYLKKLGQCYMDLKRLKALKGTIYEGLNISVDFNSEIPQFTVRASEKELNESIKSNIKHIKNFISDKFTDEDIEKYAKIISGWDFEYFESME